MPVCDLSGLVEHTPEALDAWFSQLRREHPTGRIAVALEQSRGAVLYCLLKYDFLALYPVNPRCLADYRRAFHVSGAKDDPRDADRLGELVLLHADRLRALVVEDAPTRQLRLLVEARRTFVEERSAWSNRLGATLKCYYERRRLVDINVAQGTDCFVRPTGYLA